MPKDIKDIAEIINKAYGDIEDFQSFKIDTQKDIETFKRRWIFDRQKLLEANTVQSRPYYTNS